MVVGCEHLKYMILRKDAHCNSIYVRTLPQKPLDCYWFVLDISFVDCKTTEDKHVKPRNFDLKRKILTKVST